MYPSLQHLLGAYFHQDCFVDSTNADTVLGDYLRDSSVQEVTAALGEIRQLLEHEKTEAALVTTLLDLGSFYQPSADGFTSKQWLERLASTLEERVHAG